MTESDKSPWCRISGSLSLLPATRQSGLGWWETVTPEGCCLCPVSSVTLFWLLSLQKTLLHKDRMLEMEAGFSLILWQPQGILPWRHFFLQPSFIYFFFKATENLHLDKAVYSHNRNAPTHIAKVSIRFRSKHIILPILFHRFIFLEVCGVMVNSFWKY